MDEMFAVIATTGRDLLLQRTLRSLAECRKPWNFERLILVENGSKGEAESIAVQMEGKLEVEYVYDENPGLARAQNTALRQADGGLVIFFDDDVRFQKDILVNYAQAAENEGKSAFFGGPVDVDYEEPPPDWLSSSLPPSAKGWGLDGLEQEDHGWFLGANWGGYAEEIRALGGFDEDLGAGGSVNGLGDETDMQRRLLKSGAKQVFVPRAKVWHYAPVERCNPQWLLRRYYRMGKGSVVDGWAVSGRWFGFNSWVWTELGRRVRRVVRTMLRDDREVRFKAKRKLAYFLGKMRGFWEVET